MFLQCQTEMAGVKSGEDVVKKMCAFKGEENKEHHRKVVQCVMDKGKDMARVKEWEEKKKNNKEEYKKEKMELIVKSMSCKEQVLGI